MEASRKRVAARNALRTMKPQLLVLTACLIAVTAVLFWPYRLDTPQPGPKGTSETVVGQGEIADRSPSDEPVTIPRPLDSGEISNFEEAKRYFDSLNERSPDIIKIRSFVRDNFEVNRAGLVKWLAETSNEDKLFLNAFREFGIMAVRNGYEEDYQKLFETVSALKAAALLDGVVLGLAERDPIAAFEYRENFVLDIPTSHVYSDSLITGRAVSYGKGKEALEAVQRFVPASRRTRAIADVFYTWADHNPVSAVPHLETITDVQVRIVAMKEFYNRWATRNQTAFEEWLSRQETSAQNEVLSMLTTGAK